MKINDEISRKIYEIAKDPTNKMTNREIGELYGLTESTVRHHIAKWEARLHDIAKTNDKVADVLVNHTCDCIQESQDILKEVKSSIYEAKEAGTPPEKLSGLYANWIKSLELCGELLGGLNRAPQVNVGIQFSQEVAELKALYIGELCPGCKRKVQSRLQEVATDGDTY